MMEQCLCRIYNIHNRVGEVILKGRGYLGGMIYRIEYSNGRCCNYANGRKDLLEWLKLLADEEITDIRKIYKNGVTATVFDKYKSYVKRDD